MKSHGSTNTWICDGDTFNNLTGGKTAMKLNDEQLKNISGGSYIDDLSPEDRAELKKWGDVYSMPEFLRNIFFS